MSDRASNVVLAVSAVVLGLITLLLIGALVRHTLLLIIDMVGTIR